MMHIPIRGNKGLAQIRLEMGDWESAVELSIHSLPRGPISPVASAALQYRPPRLGEGSHPSPGPLSVLRSEIGGFQTPLTRLAQIIKFNENQAGILDPAQVSEVLIDNLEAR